ncbi:MAG: alkaline phosphatase family protein [Vicinamibacterales bacterium]
MRRALLSLILLVIAVSGTAPQAAPVRPKLFVLISIDQFRGDYVQRYGGQWKHGLRALFDRGAYFSQAAYPYLNTVTCAGHSTMGTGTLPKTHGIPLNAWWDRESGKQVTCTQDDAVKNIAHGDEPARGGDSAGRLRSPTFADELRLQSGQPPRIVSLSLKARSAIMMAGHGGDLVAWHDSTRGFVTSSAYAKGPVTFLANYQRAHPIEADAGKTWRKLWPDSAYQFVDDGLGESPEGDWTRTFPHVLPKEPGAELHARWEATPFADLYLADLAIAAAKHFQLGQRNATDFLAVSFSSLDVAGHQFGPRSHEVQDSLANLDVTMGRLLDALDRQVGRDNYLLALTGDHGVAPIPEQMAAEGLNAGRISPKDVAARVDAALVPFLGPGPHVNQQVFTDLYLKAGVIGQLREQPRAMQAVRDALATVPGVAEVLDPVEFWRANSSGDDAASSAILSYVPGRSGDLILIPRPYFLNSTAGSTHGTSYDYDARVPVLLAGPGIRTGEHLSRATPADIVPTLAYLAGITMPRSDGRILHEALETNRPATTPAVTARPAASADGGAQGAQ